jgi:hypothetical protein
VIWVSGDHLLSFEPKAKKRSRETSPARKELCNMKFNVPPYKVELIGMIGIFCSGISRGGDNSLTACFGVRFTRAFLWSPSWGQPRTKAFERLTGTPPSHSMTELPSPSNLLVSHRTSRGILPRTPVFSLRSARCHW